ncbi:MAG: YtxH domain-containing protein [Schleiferilactobacillus perolens]|uniref:YtxH domain-containing protein n=1 Tax=Schleiferilactobacillus perolens TaxID=100468 RepID=UPI0039ED62D9
MAKKGHFLIGFLIGGAVAFATASLLAPKTGAQLTDKLKKKGTDGKDRAMDYYHYASDLTDTLRDQAGDKIEDLKSTFAALKDNMAVHNTLDQADEADRAAFDAETDDIGDALTAAGEDSDQDFDDIVIDGKSAFEAAKENADADQSQTATDTDPTAQDEPQTPDTPNDQDQAHGPVPPVEPDSAAPEK